MKKIGIFGGTFNPIHKSHIDIVKVFIDEMKLDICYIVPSKKSPFKIDKKMEISDMHRINMIELAIKNIEKINLSEFEIRNTEEISYTYLTIEYFQKLFPDAQLYLLIGSDNLLSFEKWKNFEYILSNCIVCIANRSNYTNTNNLDILKIYNNKLIFLNSEITDISSTNFRENFNNNALNNEVLTKEVLEYIKIHNLYNKNE